MKKTFTLIIFMISCISLSAQENVVVNDEQVWSEPFNGLASRLTFEIEKSKTHLQVIHPKLNLRNETEDTINFFWCIYEAGEFKVTDTLGNPTTEVYPPRSGPVGAKVVAISPGQIVILDAYDYGYGKKPQPDQYAFHTSFMQTNITPGKYLISYTLDYTADALMKTLKHYDWIKAGFETLWKGKIRLDEIPLNLNNDLPTKNKRH